MKVLIIGCGALGQTVATALRSKAHLTCTTTSIPVPITGVHFEPLKPSTYSKLPSLLADIDAVIVTAAASSKETYLSSYLLLARALKKALSTCPGKVLIYSSSTGVYADTQGSLVDESGALDIERSHILIETEKAYLSIPKTRVVIARLSGLYSQKRSLKHFYEAYLNKPMQQKYVNFIDIRQAALFIEYALFYPIRGVFNCCTTTELNSELFLRFTGKVPILAESGQKSSHGGSKRINSSKALTLPHFNWGASYLLD